MARSSVGKAYFQQRLPLTTIVRLSIVLSSIRDLSFQLVQVPSQRSINGLLSRSWFRLILAHAFVLQGLILIERVAITYRALEIGLDTFWIGVIGGAFGILPALLGLHLGNMIDRIGETTPLRIGAALVLVPTLCLWLFGDGLVVLVSCSVVLGLGQFICVACEHSAIARCAATGQRDRFFGRFTVSISLAQAIGPGLIALFDRQSAMPDTNGMLVLSSGAAILLMLPTMLIRLPTHQPTGERAGVWRAMLILVRSRGFNLSVLAGLVIFAAMDLLVIYLPLYGAERGISASVIGTLLALRAAASIASRLMFGRLIAMLGRGGLLVTAMLFAGGGIGVLPLTEDVPLLALAIIGTGLGLGIGAPLTLAWVSEISPVGTRAMALSLRLAANRVGQAVLPVAASAVVVGIGASGVFWATSATLGVATLLNARYFGLWRRSK